MNFGERARFRRFRLARADLPRTRRSRTIEIPFILTHESLHHILSKGDGRTPHFADQGRSFPLFAFALGTIKTRGDGWWESERYVGVMAKLCR